MTGRLKRAFEEAAKLPEKEQDELAQFVLEELASEERWSQAFLRSGDRLRELADEAVGDHERGATTALDPDAL